MISLIKQEYELHKEVTKKLYLLMKDEKALKKVLNARSLEELLIVLKEIDGGV